MQVDTHKLPGFVWAAAVIAALLVVLGGVYGPRPAFALLCHQLPGRSFVVDGHLFAVCNRCIGLYGGLVLGLLLVRLPAIHFAWRSWGSAFVRGAFLFILVDVGLDAVRVLANTPASRFLSGLMLGIAAGAFLADVILGMHIARSDGKPQPTL